MGHIIRCREQNADRLGSIWVFTLLAMEAVKTYKTNPHFMLGDTKIPTWITPLVMVIFVSVLVPNTSFLGHLCGLIFGYGCK
jgi:glycosylphosphatidylinositol transamidase